MFHQTSYEQIRIFIISGSIPATPNIDFFSPVLLPAFLQAVIQGHALAILQLVPMVLHAAEDKLNVRIVILAKSLCVFQSCRQQGIGCKVSLID